MTEALPAAPTPAFRLLAADELGQLKLIVVNVTDGEVQWEQPSVVRRWGDMDVSRAVRSLHCSTSASPGGLVSVSRASGAVDLLSGATCEPVASVCPSTRSPSTEDAVLAAFPVKAETSVGLPSFVTCTAGGSIRLHRPEDGDDEGGGDGATYSETHSFRGGPNIWDAALDPEGRALVVGGQGYEIGMFDLESQSQSWKAKGSKPNGQTRLMDQAWTTCLSWVGGAAPSQVVSGLACGKLRLYDAGRQKRPAMAVVFAPKHATRITALHPCPGGRAVWVANGAGFVEAWDLRMNAFHGALKGSGASVRSLSRHSEEPLIASVGLDRWLRVHHADSRAVRLKMYLKQQLTAAVWLPLVADAAEAPAEAEEAASPPRRKSSSSKRKGGGDGSAASKHSKSSKKR